jgi:hypothetical protein
MTLSSDCFSGSMERSGGISEFSPNAAFFRSEVGSMGKRKPKISAKRLRGEWAEMVFVVRATEHGLPVCKPWGESRGYDFVVGVPGHFVAVQVKSTTCELREGYSCSVAGHKPYPPGTFDFLAAYVVFEDAWYIIPAEKILGMECIALHSRNSNYEEYRGAWRLLDPDPNCTMGPIDIQGCAEEFSSDWIE